jgi:signal transduction histidine kinase
MPHGIGLYHSKQIADAHRADIQVVSSVGIGSTFTINLPVGKPGAEGN